MIVRQLQYYTYFSRKCYKKVKHSFRRLSLINISYFEKTDREKFKLKLNPTYKAIAPMVPLPYMIINIIYPQS